MQKLKNQTRKPGPDSRGGMAELQARFQHMVIIPAHEKVHDDFVLIKKTSVARAMQTTSKKAIRAVAASRVRRERRVMIERFGPISVHTQVIDTPAGQRVMSALDCEGVWYGRPEDLSDEDMASFGLGG